MELFSLLAKLTLDTKEYDKAISQAENEAKGFSIEEPTLGLDDDEFYEKIADAESTDVDDPDEPELGLDNEPYKQSLHDAESESSTFSGSVQSIFGELKGVLAGLGIAAVVGGIVTQLKEGVELAKNHGDQIDKQSRKMGISAEAYQKWSYALELSGASITDLNKGMKTWQASIGNEEQMTKLAEGFKALGMDADQAFERIKSGENLDQVLDQVLYGLADKNAGDRGWIGKLLFGNSWNELNPLLDNTSEQIRKMKEEAEDLGLIMSDAEVANAAAYTDATTRLQGALNGIKEAFAGEIIPLLTDATNAVAKIVAFFNPRTRDQGWAESFAETDDEMSKSLLTIEATSEAAMEMVDKLFKLGEAEKMTAEQEAEWKATADWLIQNIPSLSGVIDTDTKKINANKEAITKNIEEWKKLATERAVIQAREAKQKRMEEENAEAIDAQAKARAKSYEALEKQNEMILKANELLGAEGNEGLASAFERLFGTSTISKDAENLQDMFDWLNLSGFEYADTLPFQELMVEHDKLIEDQKTLQAEADKYSKQLANAQREYEAWCVAIEELYGVTGEEAIAATDDVKKLGEEIANLPDGKTIHINMATDTMYTRAIGDAYIPYDNFPALLHRGEKVLTATQARQESSGVNIAGLEDRIANAIRAGMDGVEVRSYLNGRDVTDDVSRNTGRELKARRFRG